MNHIVTIKPINEVYHRLIVDDIDLKNSISKLFTFTIDNKFLLRHVKGWNGNVNLLKQNGTLLPTGLYQGLIDFLDKNEIPYYSEIPDIYSDQKDYVTNFCDGLIITNNSNERMFLREHQLQPIIKCMENKKLALQMATNAGKTLFSYAFMRCVLSLNVGRFLLIVPNTDLLKQFKNDVEEYSRHDPSFDIDDVQLIYGKTKNKIPSKKIIVSIFNTLRDMPDEFFKDFVGFISDEAHRTKASSFDKILPRLTNAKYRVGISGTLALHKQDEINVMQYEAYHGPILKVVSAAELVEKNISTPIHIHAVNLVYDTNTFISYLNQKKNKNLVAKKAREKHLKRIDTLKQDLEYAISLKDFTTANQLRKSIEYKEGFGLLEVNRMFWRYQDEINFIVALEKRNRLILKNAIMEDGNSLIVIKYNENHGDVLFEMLKDMTKTVQEHVEIFYIKSGAEDKSDEVKKIVEESTKKCIIIGQIKMVAEGWSVKNLHNMHIAHPVKDHNLFEQMKGRLERKHKSKEYGNMYIYLDKLHEDDSEYKSYSYQHGMNNVNAAQVAGCKVFIKHLKFKDKN